MDRGINLIFYLTVIGTSLLFAAYYSEKWLDKAIGRRK